MALCRTTQYVLYTTKWNSNADVLKGLTNSAYCTYKNRPRYHGNLSSMMFNRQNFVINVLCHLVKKYMFYLLSSNMFLLQHYRICTRISQYMQKKIFLCFHNKENSTLSFLSCPLPELVFSVGEKKRPPHLGVCTIHQLADQLVT